MMGGAAAVHCSAVLHAAVQCFTLLGEVLSNAARWSYSTIAVL